MLLRLMINGQAGEQPPLVGFDKQSCLCGQQKRYKLGRKQENRTKTAAIKHLLETPLPQAATGHTFRF